MEIKEKIICASLIIATIFGIFGQDIAYFLNENFIKSYPIYYLTSLTVISMFLYISSMLFIFIKKTKHTLEIVSVIFIIGFPVSCWSLFCTAMWWG